MNDIGRRVQNIHTKKITVIVGDEVVMNNPDDKSVFVLNDGIRWERSLFWQHHVTAPRAEAVDRPLHGEE